MLVFQLLSFQSGESAQPHVHDGLRLGVGKLKAAHQAFLGDLRGTAGTDDMDHLVNVIQSDQQSLQDVIPFLRLIEIVFRSSGYHVLLMLQVELEHIQKIQYFGFVVHQRQHDDAEGVLKLGVLIQAV